MFHPFVRPALHSILLLFLFLLSTGSLRREEKKIAASEVCWRRSDKNSLHQFELDIYRRFFAFIGSFLVPPTRERQGVEIKSPPTTCEYLSSLCFCLAYLFIPLRVREIVHGWNILRPIGLHRQIPWLIDILSTYALNLAYSFINIFYQFPCILQLYIHW